MLDTYLLYCCYVCESRKNYCNILFLHLLSPFNSFLGFKKKKIKTIIRTAYIPNIILLIIISRKQ